ncbi:tRNA (adenine-N1)-methyltransferase [Candidatus Bathyarchaeota archaeon]|nr:tRNA (adenine-N1)-methyltransferase [Candidatus Bathyarchaeota archaeon]
MNSQSDLIREGDYVLLYLDAKRTYLVKVESGKVFHTHKGFIDLSVLVGLEYGSRVLSSLGAEFAVLKPLLRDYIMKSARKTQIIYPKDIGLIVLFSGVGPGSRVVEAGTGTGALTTALAYYVRPDGKIFSYEVREEFIKIAEKNLRRACLDGFVELKNKDITLGIDERDVDAVILDMATPWLVVSHAYEALKPCGTLVSFSPTIDQVVKTVEVLKDNGFIDIETVECLTRRMQTERGRTRPQTLMTGHTGYITFARKILKPEVRC